MSSSSSSEDEADSASPEPATKQKESEKKTTRYQCPADFVTFCHEPCSSTLNDRLKDKNTELWLIKAPVSFKPERFGGFKVPLAGLRTLKVPADGEGGGGQQIYSVMASNHGTSELRLLTADQASSNGMAFGPAFQGLMNVCESYGGSAADQAPRVIPAAPAPAIPPGLKQRFHPFGSKTPVLTCVAESEVDGAAFGPSSATLRPLVVKRFTEDAEMVEDDEAEEEGRRKKKKKKKEKRLKTQHVEEAVEVKQEPEDWPQEEVLISDDEHSEKRKKKKKKRDREREEVEEGLEPSARVKEEDVTIKPEPTDSWCGEAADGSAKKKKKKKKKCKSESE